MWEEFLTEVKGILGNPQKIGENTDEAITGLIGESIGMLDCMIWTSTSEDTKLENCKKVAANAYKLYQHYKECEEAGIRANA